MTNASLNDTSPILAHYLTGYEKERLNTGVGQLERVRTQDVLARFLPPPPAQVIDIGGGPGGYASWLASRGYGVDLLDIVPLHVEQAREAFDDLGLKNARAEVGDARQLPYASDSKDAALLLGPLYHLPSREDRLLALREAFRVLRPGGYVAVAAISRFASLFDGFFRGFMDDPKFVRIVEADLQSGRHENVTENPAYFTTAYFHLPDELAGELADAGLAEVEIIPVEGPFWCLPRFEELWSDEDRRERLLAFASKIEREPSLVGASAHLLALARKPH
jgi:ubiquinone/menaquinone biosynthesis C-methylase UbiE